MTLFLKKNPTTTYLGQNFEGENIFKSNGSTWIEEQTQTLSTGSLQNPLGNSTAIEIDHTNEGKGPASMATYRTKHLYLKFRITNSHGTTDVTFKHFVGPIDRLEFEIDGKKTIVKRREMILLYNDRLACVAGNSAKFIELSNHRSEIAETFNGETVTANGGTLDFCIDLLLFKPALNRYINGVGVKYMKITVFFLNEATNYNQCEYVLNSTNNNAFLNQYIQFTNLKLVRVLENTTDADLLNHQTVGLKPTLFFMSPVFYEIKKEVSWQTPGTDEFILDLNGDIKTSLNFILGIQVMVMSNAKFTGYNDSDACQYFSGPSWIGFELLRNGGRYSLLNYTGSSKLIDRKRYLIDFYKNRYDNAVPLELLNDSSMLSRYYMFGTYIDMSNIKSEDGDDFALSGINNNSKDWQIRFTCEGAVNANSTLLINIHYMDGL